MAWKGIQDNAHEAVSRSVPYLIFARCRRGPAGRACAPFPGGLPARLWPTRGRVLIERQWGADRSTAGGRGAVSRGVVLRFPPFLAWDSLATIGCFPRYVCDSRLVLDLL